MTGTGGATGIVGLLRVGGLVRTRGHRCGVGQSDLKVGSPPLVQPQVCTHHGHWPQLFVHHVVPPQPLPAMVLPGIEPPHLPPGIWEQAGAVGNAGKASGRP
jgi:hypothetical protein